MFYNEVGDKMENIGLEVLKIKDTRLEILHTMGITTIETLLSYYPYRYEIIEETPLIHNQKVSIEGILLDAPKVFFRGRLSRLSFSITHHLEEYKVTVFNRHFLKRNMEVGRPLTIIGKFNEKTKTIVANDIKLQLIKDCRGIEPVYSLKEGMTQKSLQGYIKKALSYCQGNIKDQVPVSLLSKHQLIHRQLALQLIHFPETKEDIKQALRYLKYEEFLKFQLTMQYIKQTRSTNKGIEKVFSRDMITSFVHTLPFALTADQVSTVKEILKDLRDNKMMYRFVQGDVGSGKTIVCAIGMYANYLAGYQGAFMAPTEILASQHYQSLVKLFKDTNIHIALLTGHLTSKEKQNIYQELAEGVIDIVIGTHALFQNKVVYKQLGFVVTDEQHRFGVNQRKALKDKGKQVDFLVMSATPIPRTLAISLYGDMDVSTIKTMPLGRKKIVTEVIRSKSMKPILPQVLEYLKNKGQCYVVCPLVAESELLDTRDATSIFQGMKAYFEGKYTVGLLHGQMSDEQKEEVMEAFKKNDIQVLVSTTVIEVGVDVANANMMVIYNAERFGLSQLHQLRGRIGRSNQQGYCYLLTNSTSEEAKQRLDFLKSCNDGFEISYFDLKMRGPGEILGNKQSGLPIFLIGDIYKDFNILEVARHDASELLTSTSNDPIYLQLIARIKGYLVKNNQYID